MSKKSFLPLMAAVFVCAVVPAWSQSELPEGNGKQAVQTYCVQCHDLGSVTRAGYGQEGWRNNLNMMINVGSALPKDQIELVTQYLAKSFPEKPQPAAVVIPGSVKISIKEWVAPTPGSRPHDPLATADGAIWYTGNFNARIGKLDPKTGQVTEYPMPDAAARDPHTPIFDQKGTLWFTVQGGNMVGRLIPQTGEVKLVTSPTPRSRPYGMVVNSKGIPFFVEFGSNKIASIDPNTMEIREYVLPNADTRPRRVAITSDDVLWYSDYSRGYLGRFDPATGKVSEWPSPGGPRSQPYAITTIKDVLWYVEAGTQPNTLVRFDPKTEKFQTWTIPSGGGVVRNMDVTRDGNLALACSGVNRIALVEVK